MTPPKPPSSSTADPRPPVSVLFVCLGNICRSPMAEGAFKALTHYDTPAQHAGIARIASCGTGADHVGAGADPRTMAELATHGGAAADAMRGHAARRIRVPRDFHEFDYVLAMDRENERDLRALVERGVQRGVLEEGDGRKVRLFGSFGSGGEDEEIEDPYYGGREGFRAAWEQVERFGRGLLKEIEEGTGEEKN